jgi:trimethylamine:corrinoid methyltransferase-like protein
MTVLRFLDDPGFVPLRASRDDLASLAQAEQVHAVAVRILSEVGLELLDDGLLDRMAAAEFAVRARRVFFEPQVIDRHVEQMRAESDEPGDQKAPSAAIGMFVSLYPHHLHDALDDTITPFTHDSLAQMTRLVDTFADEGLDGSVPGWVPDEPAPLQPVTQYLVAAENARQGAHPVDTTTPESADYVFEMAEIMGHPIRGLPVYLPTPLRLGGESLDIVMANLHRLDHISVGSMPAAGASVPMRPLAAFAVATAELLGGMVTLRELTGKEVHCHPMVLPFDMRATSMVFGSPENLLYHMLASDLNRFYGLHQARGGGNIHVMAKLPGAQAAAEKAATMSVGALLGTRYFGCAGALSLDEVFSPEQLVIDIEIRDWVQRMVAGMDLAMPDADQVLDEVRDGLKRGFLDHDATLDTHALENWYPQRFERDLLAAWEGSGRVTLRDRCRAEIEERLARPAFHLDDARHKAMTAVWETASARFRSS